MWSEFRTLFPNTTYYDDAFSYYENFYGSLKVSQSLKDEIKGYAEFHERLDQSEQEQISLKTPSIDSYIESLDTRLPRLELQLSLLLGQPLSNDDEEHVVVLLEQIIPFRIPEIVFDAVEILIRSQYGSKCLEPLIPKLMKLLSKQQLKRLATSLDLEYSLDTIKSINSMLSSRRIASKTEEI